MISDNEFRRRLENRLADYKADVLDKLSKGSAANYAEYMKFVGTLEALANVAKLCSDTEYNLTLPPEGVPIEREPADDFPI